MAGQGTNYFGNHVGADQVLQGTPNYNVEVSEGQNPPGQFYPAGYLPLVQSENRIGGSHFVIMGGKVIAMDSTGRLIPAGLAYEVNNSGTSIAYTSTDADNGVIKPNGQIAVATDAVATAMAAATGGALGATVPVGIMRYSALRAPGSDPGNPATFYKHSYDTGGGKAFSRWAYIQVPVVETSARVEVIGTSAASGIATDFRITLYPKSNTSTDISIQTTAAATGGVLAIPASGMVASPAFFTWPTTGNPTQFAIQGRTIFFNRPVPANWAVKYNPRINLPFTCLTTGGGVVGGTGGGGATQVALADMLGGLVTYNLDSNFCLDAAGPGSSVNIGRILDVKNGSDSDLKYVRSYFRDAGMWQEQPGSATDGRNTQLSLINAPKWIARIAVNFNGLNF